MGTKATLPSREAMTSWPVMPRSGTESRTLPLAGSTIARLWAPFSATSRRDCWACAVETSGDKASRERATRIVLKDDLQELRNEYISARRGGPARDLAEGLSPD